MIREILSFLGVLGVLAVNNFHKSNRIAILIKTYIYKANSKLELNR